MLKKILQSIVVLLVLAWPSLAQLQNGTYQGVALKQIAGLPSYPAAGATITVCTFPGAGVPCTNTVTIYGGPSAPQTTNPFTTDVNGNFSFWAPQGNYTVTVSGVGITGYAINVSIASGTSLLGLNNTWTGTNTDTLLHTFNGGISTTTTNSTGAGTHSGTEAFTGNITATAGQNVVNFGTSNNIIYLDGSTYPRTCAGINAAIAAAPHGTGSNLTPNASPAGAKIVLGFGDISCNTTVIIDRPITLEGSGEAGRLVIGAGLAGSVAVHVTKNSNSVINQYGQAIGVRLNNIWVEDTAFRSQNTDCLWVEGNDEVMMDKFECKWLKGYGLQLDNNGTNPTPVRESNFYNFVSWGCGDPAQSKASLMIITNSAPGGSDEINEIRFKGGGVKAEWWEAVHIDSGQPGISGKQGPRLIFFDNFQIEARATLDNSFPLVPAIAPNSNNVHIVKGNTIFFHGGSMSNAGQGKSALQVDGSSSFPVLGVSLDDMNIGGNPALTGNVTCTNVANSVCTWQSGNQFQPVVNTDWAGLTISITGAACSTSCVILSQQSATQITLTTNSGTVTNQPYTISSGGWGMTANFLTGLSAKCVNWIGNPLGNLNPTIANTNQYTFTEMPCTQTNLLNINLDTLDVISLASDVRIGLQNNTASTGQRWVWDSKSDGTSLIAPATSIKNLSLNPGGNLVISIPSLLEQGPAGGAGGFEIFYGDSTAHAVPINYNNSGITNFWPKTVALVADWTCGTGGTVASCTSATIIGSGGGVPLTFILPLVSNALTLECDGVVGQATAATANQWNLLTATNGATNVTAIYDMYTAATAKAGGAVTDQASTTTTFQISPSWTLGATGTKMPFHIWAKVEGASASGTVVSLQLLAPTVGDLVTIYRGTSCRIY